MADRTYFPKNTPKDVKWDYHRGGLYVGDVAWSPDASAIFNFIADRSKETQILSVARPFRDKYNPKLAAPPVQDDPINVSPGEFTAKWQPVTGYTQFKLAVYTNYPDRILHPDYAGIIVSGTQADVVMDWDENTVSVLETVKDGQSVSLPSNRKSPEAIVAAGTFRSKLIATGGSVATCQETSGTDWVFNVGGNGVLTPNFALQQPGLFSSYADKSINFIAGYGKKTLTAKNLKTVQAWFIMPVRFANKNGDSFAGGFMSSTSDGPHLSVTSGANLSSDGFVQMRNNSAVMLPVSAGGATTAKVPIPNIVDGQEHIIACVVRIVSGVRYLEIYYRETTTAVKLYNLTLSNTDDTLVNQFIMGGAVRATIGKTANIFSHDVAFGIDTTPPTEAEFLDIMNTGVFA